MAPQPVPAVPWPVPWAGAGGCCREACSRRAISAVSAGGSQPPKSRSERPAARSHSPASSAGVARSSGAAVRQRSRRGCSASGYPSSRGGRCEVLAIWAAMVMAPPSPYGCRPVAARAAISPSEKTSVAGPTASPSACSGDMNCGVPIRPPLRVSWVASAARAMPKSMTHGPAGPSRMLPGLRSRCTTPAAWIAARACAVQPTSWNTAGIGSGPYVSSAVWSATPGT